MVLRRAAQLGRGIAGRLGNVLDTFRANPLVSVLVVVVVVLGMCLYKAWRKVQDSKGDNDEMYTQGRIDGMNTCSCSACNLSPEDEAAVDEAATRYSSGKEGLKQEETGGQRIVEKVGNSCPNYTNEIKHGRFKDKCSKTDEWYKHYRGKNDKGAFTCTGGRIANDNPENGLGDCVCDTDAGKTWDPDEEKCKCDRKRDFKWNDNDKRCVKSDGSTVNTGVANSKCSGDTPNEFYQGPNKPTACLSDRNCRNKSGTPTDGICKCAGATPQFDNGTKKCVASGGSPPSSGGGGRRNSTESECARTRATPYFLKKSDAVQICVSRSTCEGLDGTATGSRCYCKKPAKWTGEKCETDSADAPDDPPPASSGSGGSGSGGSCPSGKIKLKNGTCGYLTRTNCESIGQVYLYKSDTLRSGGYDRKALCVDKSDSRITSVCEAKGPAYSIGSLGTCGECIKKLPSAPGRGSNPVPTYQHTSSGSCTTHGKSRARLSS